MPRTPTRVPYAGIVCPHHGKVDIDYDEYMRQMYMPDSRWKCPCCGMVSEFDDERYEEIHIPPEEDEG